MQPTISALFQGTIDPMRDAAYADADYKALLNEASWREKEIAVHFPKEDTEALSALLETFRKIGKMESEISFASGFRLGCNLMMEVMKK